MMITTSGKATDLATDYYLSNFVFLMNWVNERYADVLSAEEQCFIARFRQLDHDAQCLLVRLASRKGPLFRRDKLHYPEISTIDRAASSLISAELLHHHHPIDLAVLGQALTKAEVLHLFADDVSDLKHARKAALLHHLAQHHSTEKSWYEWTRNQLGDAYFFAHHAIVRTLQLMFFGNTEQDLSQFVLQDLGLFRFEQYSIDRQHRVFKCREEVDQYQQLIALRDQFEHADTLPALLAICAQIPAACCSERLQRRRAKLCNRIAYALERGGETALAVRLYQQSHLPPARERCIRILEKRGDFSAAWAALQPLLENPWDEQERQIAQRMAPRLAKKASTEFSANPAVTVQQLQLTLSPTAIAGHITGVEEAVRLAVTSETSPCFFVENALFLGLFGLWLWPEMFRSIDGAFANPFQAAPLDMYQEDFSSRRPGMTALWQLLKNSQHSEPIRQRWRTKYGISNHFVSWSQLTEDLLALALHCIPAHHLACIFERLLFDIRSNRSGFPDLIQFYPHDKRYRLIEVKGPGDRLQDNQRRWLDYFAQHAIPAEVCHVRWQ